MISVVLPVYDERDNLAVLLREIDAALGDRPYEVVAVDDGSTDGSLEELRRQRCQYPALRVVALARHAGQSAALVAGFALAQGEVVVTLDADGQNDPADVSSLLDLLERDAELSAVIGYRVRRVDSVWRRLQSSVANAVRNWVTGDSVCDTGCGLRVFRRGVLQHVPRFEGMHRFLPTLVRREGGRVVEVPVSHRRRLGGRSKYGMWNRGPRALRDAFGVRWLLGRRLQSEFTEEDEG